MDFNIFLIRFGLNPDDFENKYLEPIVEDNKYIYEVDQKVTSRICPECGSLKCYVDGHYKSRKRCQQNEHINDFLVINRVQMKCYDCGKKFSIPLYGIENHTFVSKQTEGFIRADLRKPLTFQSIAKRYGYTRSAIIKKFDQMYPVVPRFSLDEIICIDEFGFTDPDIKSPYACAITSYTKKSLIDILPARDQYTLSEYFGQIHPGEIKKVKVFISDMFEGYAKAHDKFFPNSIHVIDLFHVVKDLTSVINTLRIRTMNQYLDKGSLFYNFMKTNWKEYLCRDIHISDKFYTHKKTNVRMHYAEIVFESVKVNKDLWDGYKILQELLKYTTYHTYEEAYQYIEHISQRLLACKEEKLQTVGKTYHHFRVQIANAFRTKEVNKRYTNAIAECLNNHLKTLIKISNGCYNFNRFRKRALLIDVEKKEQN